jgi:hypothetical protein
MFWQKVGSEIIVVFWLVAVEESKDAKTAQGWAAETTEEPQRVPFGEGVPRLRRVTRGV